MTFLPEIAVPQNRAGLPMPALRPPRAVEEVYCVATTVDARGRLADGSPARVLGWSPGQLLTIVVTAGVVQLATAQDSALALTKQGYLRLPSEIRHAIGLVQGDRVLAVARPALDTVMIYSMPVLAELLRPLNGPSR
ncbi:hypothetical protein GCM10010170_070050 [Dactylosporangium salmoneum]|uniref:SpoVT-AbrB domain-containing protein n=1 Tax=Dactylosporangium salmoneum TaxID=53361 RepID=A0ABN3H584_9ACTN